MMPPIMKRKLRNALCMRCSHLSTPMNALRRETASSEDAQKKYMPMQNKSMYKMPGTMIHFHKRCLLINWCALK